MILFANAMLRLRWFYDYKEHYIYVIHYYLFKTFSLCVACVALGKWYWSLIKTDVKVGGWVNRRGSGSLFVCGICGRAVLVSVSEALKWHALDNNTKSSSQSPCFPVTFPGSTGHANAPLKCNWNRQRQPVSDKTADSDRRQWLWLQ